MCGICGTLAFASGFATDASLLSRMSDTLSHRGPDDSGVWRSDDGAIGFGHRRLSIVDLSSAGHQPMANEDGTVWITYNGEVYNHRALRVELEAKGHRYRSQTDTETILHLYEEEGRRCVERLHGMFAFAIWDSRRRELFLARDRLGVKPLYYAQLRDGFVFGSEIKAILEHPAVGRDLDESAFFHYLTFVATPAPQTLFAGVRKLAPSERMTVSADGATRSETYWEPLRTDTVEAAAALSEDEARDRLLELLRAAVAKRMMSDVPFGVFLSGGVDSSANVALMSELMDEPVRTFSVAFRDHERYNELRPARAIAQRFATRHHEVMIGVEDLERFLPQLVWHQDEPLADWVCVPLYYVAKLARESGTIVVQIGEGSDEILHGYRAYARHAAFAQRFSSPIRRLPRPLRARAGRAALATTRRLGRGEQYGQLVASAAADRLSFWGGAIAFQGDLKESVIGNGRPHPDAYAVVERLWSDAGRALPTADLLQRMTYLELRQRLAELLLMRVDKMTMATSVEARVPFLDHELVEFAVALPPHFKVRNGNGKHLLKEALAQTLPPETLRRPKQGFGAPVSEWFRSDFGSRAQRMIRESSLADRGLLDYDTVDRLWERHRSGGNWGLQLWTLLNVSLWHDRWLAA